jgi:uncharacterized membrane protein
MPFVAPCRELHWTAPFGWLKKGIGDFRRAKRQSLIYGMSLVLLSWLVTGAAWILGRYVLVLAALTGFVFLGPALAVCAYSISRQLERDDVPTIRRCLISGRRHLGSAMVFAIMLMVVFLVWARAASLVHVFFPFAGEYEWRDLLPFLGVGSAVGTLFGAIVFAASAFSLPMLVDREADIATAVVTSVNAVLRNKLAMSIWILLIVTGVAIGFATAFIGLFVVLPVLGYATWHSYRECIDASAWPAHPPLPIDGADKPTTAKRQSTDE